MKLLKYVMTNDTGLAPNPFFGVCSLAICTPNHVNARLDVDDWVLGHSSRKQGNKLIYAMRVTRILDMPSYFAAYPEKRPNPMGSRMEQCGDNIYDNSGGRWSRLPSACHNNVEAFKQDQGRRVFLAEGNENFWYFGGENSLIDTFNISFPQLIKDRQGISYIRNRELISKFELWLKEFGQCGLLGSPRDCLPPVPSKFLLAIEPEEQWLSIDGVAQKGTIKAIQTTAERTSENECGRKPKKFKSGCT